jgi:hypothetical protein
MAWAHGFPALRPWYLTISKLGQFPNAECSDDLEYHNRPKANLGERRI